MAKYSMSPCTVHKNMLSMVTPAVRHANIMRHVLKRSCFRKPTAVAQDDMPLDEPCMSSKGLKAFASR